MPINLVRKRDLVVSRYYSVAILKANRNSRAVTDLTELRDANTLYELVRSESSRLAVHRSRRIDRDPVNDRRGGRGRIRVDSHATVIHEAYALIYEICRLSRAASSSDAALCVISLAGS